MLLTRRDPETAQRLHHQMEEHIQLRQERLRGMARPKQAPPPAAAEEQGAGKEP
jgi:hypothetical protein